MRRPPRRLAAAALGLVALVLAAAPAGAHMQAGEHTVSFHDDDRFIERDSPDDGAKINGLDYVVGYARMDDGIARWKIEMKPEAGGPSAYCDKSGDFGTELTFRCNWDTTRLGDMSALAQDQPMSGGALAPNGRYVLIVSAWNKGRSGCVLCKNYVASEHVASPNRTVIIQNPASAPTGVSRAYDSNTGRVTVTWAANPEPDIQKYVIQEKRGSGGWENVGERPHEATSFERQLSELGTYQYRVGAVRPEVAQPTFSAESAALEVAAPPPPPGTTTEAPAPSGPEPGVTTFEEPTTSTTVQAGAVPAPVGAARPPAGGGSSLFDRPAVGSVPRPTAPRTTPTTIDTGYSAELPYNTAPKQTQKGVLEDDQEVAGAEQPQSMTKIITVPRPRDPRSLLVPLAGGLTIFVFAMQLTYVVRKRPALANIDDDFGDWTGSGF